MSGKVNNLYFTNNLVVHVGRTIPKQYYFATPFCIPTNPLKYPYTYKIPVSVISKIENGGEYNTHYWPTLERMIKTIEQISKQKFLKKTYYTTR